jgi:hypothetical protein
MLCDVISAVTEFMVRVLHSRGVLLGFLMLCDVISAVTEVMVRVLHSREVLLGSLLGFTPLLFFKRTSLSDVHCLSPLTTLILPSKH